MDKRRGIDSVADIVEPNACRREDNAMEACPECLRLPFNGEVIVTVTANTVPEIIAGIRLHHRKLLTSIAAIHVICAMLFFVSLLSPFFYRLVRVYP